MGFRYILAASMTQLERVAVDNCAPRLPKSFESLSRGTAKKPVSFPKQPFHFTHVSPAKKKQTSVKRVKLQLPLHDCRQTVNPFSHIRVPGYKIHIHILRKLFQHDCKACSTRAIVDPLTSEGKDIFICSVVISILSEERGDS